MTKSFYVCWTKIWCRNSWDLSLKISLNLTRCKITVFKSFAVGIGVNPVCLLAKYLRRVLSCFQLSKMLVTLESKLEGSWAFTALLHSWMQTTCGENSVSVLSSALTSYAMIIFTLHLTSAIWAEMSRTDMVTSDCCLFTSSLFYEHAPPTVWSTQSQMACNNFTF